MPVACRDREKALPDARWRAWNESTAAIQNPTGNVTVYRRHNKPALGPVGDSLDDFDPDP